jgi:Ribonuclease H2 non-catalytic subunit (Ylr154p-like)
MPFHINHTGPAPVSTYFRIRPVPLAPASSETHLASAATLEESESQLPNANAAGTAEASLEDKENGPVAITPVTITATAPTSWVLRPSPIQRLSESAKRFISSFRGRTVHGVDVALPKGYTGIILRGDADGDERQMARCKTKRWPTRQVRGKPVGGDLDDSSGTLSEEDRPMRTLKPAARFDSFVLWHPDNPVDEGKDEYLRSLSEWVNIAAEVCVGDCLPFVNVR